MPEYLSPAVYVEEVSGGIKPIEGVGTSTGAFIGIAEKGPIGGAQYEGGVGRPVLITNFGDFTRVFGGFVKGEYLAYAVRQFFGEGGTRCYVTRTAHFTDPSDPSTLTATRAGAPLGGIQTTLANPVNAGATQADLVSAAGLSTGMELFIYDNDNGARVTISAVAGNTVTFANTPIPAGINFAAGATVLQVVLDIRALNEGEWGNNLRVTVGISGQIQTTLTAALAQGDTQATVASVQGIEVGMTLFISDGAASARVQVTRIEEGLSRITFRNIDPTETPAIANGANVNGIILGKASTILDGALNAGATEADLLSTEGMEIGTILLFVEEDVSANTFNVQRAVVSRVVGKKVFFVTGLAAAVADGAGVFAEDFSITVYDGNDVVETFANLTMENSNETDYVENRINLSGSRSRYIRVKEAPLVSGNTPPNRISSPLRLGSLASTEGLEGQSDGQGDYIGSEAAGTGFRAFDSVDDINIVAAPGITIRPVILAGMTYCENRGDCFYVGELPLAAQTVTEVLDFKNGAGTYAGQQGLISKYGSLYWPWIQVIDPLTNRPISMAPSGAVVGSYSATDVKRGVHKAPAGIDDGFLNTVSGIEKVVTKGEHDLLNPQGVNVIRSFPGIGIVIWGARTTSSDSEWKYINVRRLFLFLEESIDQGTQWVVFEPNDKVLWARIIRNVSAFLRIQWLEGKLVGDKPEQAFFVKCDESTNPPESVDLGRVITEIGVAPSKPAEFVVFRIMQARPE